MSIFITFEGPEGSGKTTQIALLARSLMERRRTVLMTREPGGTRIGDAVRGVLLDSSHTEMSERAEALLFNAARAQLVEQVIKPALARGEIVLCDRYGDSTLAYQGYGHGQPLEPLRQLIEYATGGLTPNLTIYLDLDVRKGLARKRAGAAEEWNRIEEKTLVYHEAVRQGYLQMATHSSRWLVVDADQPVEAIQTQILARVDTLSRDVPGAVQ
ncbi:MAG: dTMP kinase [Caldilineaceae bacterium]